MLLCILTIFFREPEKLRIFRPMMMVVMVMIAKKNQIEMDARRTTLTRLFFDWMHFIRMVYWVRGALITPSHVRQHPKIPIFQCNIKRKIMNIIKNAFRPNLNEKD